MSALNLYTDRFFMELNEVCYGEGMVPLICITMDKGGNYGLFVDAKYDHGQKAAILNTGLNVAIRQCYNRKASVLEIKSEYIDEKKMNEDTDDFLNNGIKFCYNTGMIPVVVILGKSTGKCTIYDDNNLSPEQVMETIIKGMKALKAGIHKELDGMKRARHLDTNDGKIYEA